jgi:cell division protein FtsX
MVSFRFAWLLLRQRLWQSFQTALGVALLILAALAGLSWYAQRMQMLNQQKAAFTLHLVLASEITDDQARALASDLRALAPSLLASVELLSDTAWIERLQSRYGIALNELSGERIFPLALRVRFVPEQMTQAAVAAFIEQCAQVSMIRTINFSPRMLASLAEGESNLQQQSLMLGLGWLALATLGQLLQLRTTLPLPRRDSQTLLLLGAPLRYPRRVRMLFALVSALWGLLIAAGITTGAWALHIPHLASYQSIAVPAALAAFLAAGMASALGWLLEPV